MSDRMIQTKDSYKCFSYKSYFVNLIDDLSEPIFNHFALNPTPKKVFLK